MNASLALFTSCAANYIPKARVLAQSIRKFYPEADVYLLLVDPAPEHFNAAQEGYTAVVTAESLAIPDFERWVFGHRIVEACTAVKPFMLNHLLGKGYEKVIYFDPDIAIFHPLTCLMEAFEAGSILLTPHINEPESTLEAVKDNELNSLKHGLYNFGFVGVKNDAAGRRYAKWWEERCYFRCFDDISGGNFTDQKWNDLVPIFFEGVELVKHPGCNVATWNYAQRKLEGSLTRGITVNGQPLIFHHFTGFDSGAHLLMRDKYGKDMPAAVELSHWYTDSCARNSDASLEKIRWSYGYYDNGEAVKPHHRVLYRQREDLREAFPHPFSSKAQGKYRSSYYEWLKNEGLLHFSPVNEAKIRPFKEFLQQTRFDLEGYIQRTSKLANWQKNVIRKALSLLTRLLPINRSKA